MSSVRSRAALACALGLAFALACALAGCASSQGGQQPADSASDPQPLEQSAQQAAGDKDPDSGADSADEGSGASTAGSNAILKSTSKAVEDSKAASADDSKTASAAQATCEHDWKVETKTVATEAQTETVEVPATWEEQTKLETVCNACMAVVTGNEAAHTAATGHSHFTPNVPVRQMVQASEARTETRTVSEAGSKEVPTGFDVCTRCGLERQSTEEELAAYSQG